MKFIKLLGRAEKPVPAPMPAHKPAPPQTPVPSVTSSAWFALLAILASALLCGLYARGGMAYLLGFVMLLPYLRVLDARRSIAGTLACAWLMSIAFSAAVFYWFGFAIGNYTKAGEATGLAVLLICAPLFQPQFFSFAIVRLLASRRFGKLIGVVAAAAAWVASEWLIPKLLGDTLGHGLYPSSYLRQGAALGGAAGLSFLLLLCNEGANSALTNALKSALKTESQARSLRLRLLAQRLALTAIAPCLLALYGYFVLANTVAPTGPQLRVGLIQSNIVDYEQQRQRYGSYAAVRMLLDTHFAMSYDAVERQHADAVLWSETSYPTTFGQPKSQAGAELDQSILSIVKAAGVPFVFGTYEGDANGEYNAAAFVMPETGLLGFYRKTRLFPLTEYVPRWLNLPLMQPFMQAYLPWTGNWQAGNGARVLPLRLRDGREIPILPLICRDDVDSMLGIAGARLGAQAIFTMSNDAWFSKYPEGARLHQTVAAFRSIETRLPQFRVTSNGFSGVIDQTGNILTTTRMGEQSLVIGQLPVAAPPRTLLVLWGDWFGPAALSFLAVLLLQAAFCTLAAWPLWHKLTAQKNLASNAPIKVAILPPAARLAVGLLRSFSRLGLLWLGLAMLQNDALRGNTLAQLRSFTGLFLLPEAAASCILLAFTARATIADGKLRLSQGARRIEIALSELSAIQAWRLPIPGPGICLRLTNGQAWRYGLSLSKAAPLLQAFAQAGIALETNPTSAATAYAQARMAIQQGRLDQTLIKFVVLPFLLAFPAYYLHQHIAYGSGFGEYTAFGLKAWLTGLALWCSAWAIGLTLCSMLLRVLIEASTMLAVLLRPAYAIEIRRWFEAAGKIALYLGVPAWLVMRVWGG